MKATNKRETTMAFVFPTESALKSSGVTTSRTGVASLTLLRVIVAAKSQEEQLKRTLGESPAC